MQERSKFVLVLLGFLVGCHSEYRKDCHFARKRPLSTCVSALVDAEKQIARSTQLRDRYQLTEAEAALSQALSLQREALGPNNHHAVDTLIDLSKLHGDQGKLTVSLVLLDQANRSMERMPYIDPDARVKLLKKLARQYQRNGRLYKAKELFTNALSELRKLSTIAYEEIPLVELELARLYFELEQYDQTENYIQQAIADSIPMEDDKNIYLRAEALASLAEHYHQMSNYKRAAQIWTNTDEFLTQKKLTDRIKSYTIYAKSAKTYLLLNEQQKARALVGKVKRMFGRIGLKELNYCARSELSEIASAIAQVSEYMNDTNEALTYYAFTLKNTNDIEKRFGPKSDIAGRDEVQGMARVLYRQEKYEEAKRLFWLSAEMHEDAVLLNGVTKSEHLLEKYIIDMSHQDKQVYTYSGWHGGKDLLKELELALTLLHQGRATDIIADNIGGLQQGLSPENQVALSKLRFARQRYAEQMLRLRSNDGNIQEHDRLLTELSAQISQQEEELARRQVFIGSWSRKNQLRTIVKDVTAQLTPGDVLINFVTYVPTWYAHPDESSKNSAVYKAILLWPDGRIEVVNLGAATLIENDVTQLSAQLSRRDGVYEGPARAVYQRVIAPLEPLLRHARQVYLSLDGQLHLVPFHILRDGGPALGERFRLVYLSSGRDLLRKSATGAPSAEVVVFADPDFGAALPVPFGSKPRGVLAEYERERAQVRTDRHDRIAFTNVARLPGTRQEAEAIRTMFPQARLLTDESATEGEMLQLRAPAILHIATHGFFLGGDDSSQGRSARMPEQFEETEPPIENLMLRSGLLMAGASKTVRPEGSDPLAGDGIATALELAGMNLHGTQLVVLSACESGKGSIRQGQGVYGLRRSFFTSGAETLVTSLWKVDDEVTAELMRAFYARLLRGEGRAAALQNAAFEIRKQHPHPYYWAAFITIGQSGPLSRVSGQR